MIVVSIGSTGFAVLRREANEGGFSRPIVKEVVEKYLGCGNPRCGFARIRCPDCAEERLVMFSCRTRGFCPSCHAKRIDDSRLAEIFAREVRAKTKIEAERVGEIIIADHSRSIIFKSS